MPPSATAAVGTPVIYRSALHGRSSQVVLMEAVVCIKGVYGC
jgi:hypothetical protein